MAEPGGGYGAEGEGPQLGDIFEFEGLNQLLQDSWSDIGKDLWKSDLFVEDGALTKLLGDVGGGNDGGGLAGHLQDHVRGFPINDAVAAGAWLAFVRSRGLELAPRFFLRVDKKFRVLIGPLPNGEQIGVIASVPETWEFLASKALPVPEMISQFSQFESRAFDIEAPSTQLPRAI